MLFFKEPLLNRQCQTFHLLKLRIITQTAAAASDVFLVALTPTPSLAALPSALEIQCLLKSIPTNEQVFKCHRTH